MKLIPLSEYVLLQVEKREKMEITQDDLLRLIVNYTKFLRQPLTLSMFVPADEDGNVLKKPDRSNFGVWTKEFWKRKSEFEKAKEKVLFKGFHIEWHSEIIIGIKNDSEVSIAFDKKTGLHGVKQNVEWLCSYGLPLTPSALKMIISQITNL